MSHHVANNLSERHILGPAKDIHTDELRLHLMDEHRVYPKSERTAADLGKTHLLAHTVQALPSVGELIHGKKK